MYAEYYSHTKDIHNKLIDVTIVTENNETLKLTCKEIAEQVLNKKLNIKGIKVSFDGEVHITSKNRREVNIKYQVEQEAHNRYEKLRNRVYTLKKSIEKSNKTEKDYIRFKNKLNEIKNEYNELTEFESQFDIFLIGADKFRFVHDRINELQNILN